MDWQSYFRGQILDRGYDYYCDGAVDDLKRKKDTLTATVSGTDDYHVEITIAGGIISSMYCSCPYAEDGNNCKHMAATLFEWEDSSSDNEETPGDKESIDTAAGLVSAADDETVRKFLIQILENDDKLLIRFKSISVKDISKADMQKYKNQVDRVVATYQDRHNYIDYSTAYEFIRAVEEFLYDDVQIMLDDRCYLEAFELTCYVFTTVGNVDMDDSGGGTGMLAEHCYKIWQNILEESDENTKKAIFEWFINHLDGSVIDYMEDYIERITMEEFTDKEYLIVKLEFTDKKVKEAEKRDDSWSRNRHAGHWAMNHITIMESCGHVWDDVEQYCMEHWSPSAVRKYYIDQCLKQERYDRAIEVLKESMQLDSEHRVLMAGYSEKLKELYKLRGMHEQYLEMLWQMALKDNAGDLETFRELKGQYSDAEWKEKRERLFTELPPRSNIDRLYKEEKLYDRLLEYVLSSSGLYALNEYRSDLEYVYPHEILKKYRDEVESMARHASNRSRYKELVAILRTMQKIAGGKEIVDEIVSRWKTAYRNRSAMMEELRRL